MSKRSDIAVIYYCYGNSSPIDIWYNPIPSICSLRMYDQDISIHVLYGAGNKHLFEPYQDVLDFKLFPFTCRTGIGEQMCYKTHDSYDHIMSNGLTVGLTCDSDIMWHSSATKFIDLCSYSTKECIWVCKTLNAGLVGIHREANFNMLANWGGIAHLLALYKSSAATNDLLMRNYKTVHVHDESALAILTYTMGHLVHDIYFYPDEYAYCPPISLSHDLSLVKSVHYCKAQTVDFYQRVYNPDVLAQIGRVGVIFTIDEYANCIKLALGSRYRQFANNFLFGYDKIPEWIKYAGKTRPA
jgi:hypothetical protein